MMVKKIYFIKCNKYRKFENSKISYVFYAKLVLSITFDKCGSNDENIFEEEESFRILKVIGLINNMNM